MISAELLIDLTPALYLRVGSPWRSSPAMSILLRLCVRIAETEEVGVRMSGVRLLMMETDGRLLDIL